MWNIRGIKVILVVVGVLGSTTKKLKNCIDELGVVISKALLEKTTLVGRVCFEKVLDCSKICRYGVWGKGKRVRRNGKLWEGTDF